MLLQTELENCLLRPWAMHDKSALIQNGNNRKIWRNLTDHFPHPYTEADAERWLDIANQGALPSQLAIQYNELVVGNVGAMIGDDVAKFNGEFGYWLGEAHWGQGIATAAAQTMAAYAFSQLGLERLEAHVFAWNPASMRVLEKAGFVRESVRKRAAFKDGEFVDDMIYVLLRPDN